MDSLYLKIKGNWKKRDIFLPEKRLRSWSYGLEVKTLCSAICFDELVCL